MPKILLRASDRFAYCLYFFYTLHILSFINFASLCSTLRTGALSEISHSHESRWNGILILMFFCVGLDYLLEYFGSHFGAFWFRPAPWHFQKLRSFYNRTAHDSDMTNSLSVGLGRLGVVIGIGGIRNVPKSVLLPLI